MLEFNTDPQTLGHRFAALALPVDATECGDWGCRGENDWRRGFLTEEWDVAGLWVSVAGEQNHLGVVTRWVHVGGEDRCTTADRRNLIDALTEAGKLLETL